MALWKDLLALFTAVSHNGNSIADHNLGGIVHSMSLKMTVDTITSSFLINKKTRDWRDGSVVRGLVKQA